MKNLYWTVFRIFFIGFFLISFAIHAQENEPDLEDIPFEEEIIEDNIEEKEILESIAEKKSITKNSEKKTQEEFEKMQRSPNKNHRKYKITLSYLKNFLEPKDFKTESGEKVKASDLDFQIIKLRLEEHFIKNQKTPQEEWSNLNEEYKKLENLFHDVQFNTVKELRHSIPNGGILPGSRNTAGGTYLGETVLPKFINTLLILSLSISTLLIIVAGFMYIFSYGEDETKKKAKDIIFWTIVGTAIMVTAYAIVKFVININFEI